ncbi:MAG: peptigoglycan-binding protein LysM [Pseudomonadota bacterium]
MSRLAAFLSANTGFSVTAAAVLVAAVGTGAYVALRDAAPDPAAVTTEAAQPAPAPSVAPAATQTAAVPAPEAPPTPAATPDPAPPRIDEVRFQDGGIFVVAGRALPGSTVAVLLDGLENTEAVTSGDGAFAAVSVAMPSPDARVLTIVQRGADGDVAGLEEVIIAPLETPEPEPEPQMAEAPDPEPQPTVADPAAAPAPQVVEAPVTEPEPQVAEAPASAPAPQVADVSTAEPEPQVLEAPVTAPAPQVVEAPVIEPERQVAEAPAPEPAPQVAEAPAAIPAPQATAAAADPQVAVPTQSAAREPQAAPAAPAGTGTRVAILRSTADGVVLTNPGPAPEVMDRVALDTISYSDTGTVQLAGRAQPEAEVVRVYLDNRVIADLPVDDAGNWRGDLPDVDTGIYTLRIDEVKETGAVVSRVETPFKREDPEVLQAATDPSLPAQAITVQSGATLWAIARERYGQGRLYVRVFEANRDSIRDPDLIFPGQVFALPN